MAPFRRAPRTAHVISGVDEERPITPDSSWGCSAVVISTGKGKTTSGNETPRLPAEPVTNRKPALPTTQIGDLGGKWLPQGDA